MLKRYKFFGAIVLAVAVYSCSTVPLTGRKQFNVVSDAEVNQSAATSYKELLSDPKTKVVSGTTDAQRVQKVGRQLATAIQQYLQQNGYGNQYNFDWQFNLIQSSDVNAWCMPGGKVAVYTGILPYTKDDAGLATVLGHEIGHAIAHHSAERISQQYVAQGLGSAIGTAAGNSSSATVGIVNQLYGVGGSLLLLKYSRNQESEADKLGLTFMAMAGYDPHQAIGFWQRMAAANTSGGTPEFLSTHPADATRIAALQNELPNAMKYYRR
ncbi:M48 family metallopeptidase [Mucilaginibacter sp. KACC 22063]|uniref:M48 family metallopeptidase n=1 Tax=Mucilaginibacter sp. KACC 22063 TaxID=3025666 RepID=UPI002365DB2B|nr:M48 family metallopeptidase [Mucilaginibacter sp. KACC 22063]WDF56860.1 M48 family metallopeptidase [Mucilaginibacter sp. KACC 22063]